MFSTLKENDIHIEYSGTFLPAAEADGYFAHLKELEFYPLTLKFSERTVTPLRRICAFSDGGQMDYTFSGATVKSSPWTPALLEIKQRVETTFNQSYNLCLVNIYPNGSAYISPHRDDEKFHVEGSSIATISFGDTRTITFTRSGFEPINYDLQHGSALIMYSPTNSYWKHGIKKTSNSDVRISLTFHTMKVMSHTPQPCVSKDDDSLIEAEYANLFKTSYYNAQSDLLDYERSKIHHLVQRRKEAKRKPVDSFGDENDDFNKKLRAINELDLDFDIVKLKLSDTLYLSCAQFNGELKVHLREHYQDSNGLYKPTKYGFTWTLDTWYAIYIKFNDFTLKYSNTSFIANNTVAFMSFSESLVIKSLYRAEQTLTLNAAQLKKI